MIKPPRLQPGDKVAAISLSWGGAGDIPNRYLDGVRQIEAEFGLKVVPTTHALRENEFLKSNPASRAADLHDRPARSVWPGVLHSAAALHGGAGVRG